MVNEIDIESESQIALEINNRSRIKQIKKSSAYVPKKDRKKVEVKLIGVNKLKEKENQGQGYCSTQKLLR